MPDSTSTDLGTEWDERYNTFAHLLPDLVPNAVLETEAGALKPGRALDVGCGGGAEAVWLATRGWDVTGLDVSQVALGYAEQRGQRAGVDVRWICGDLANAGIADTGFDLVTAFYPALLHSETRDAQRGLLSAVTIGGTLLVVHHADIDAERAKAHGFDVADYLNHDDVIEMLDDTWDVRIQRRRLRAVPTGPNGEHTHDDVVVARRLR